VSLNIEVSLIIYGLPAVVFKHWANFCYMLTWSPTRGICFWHLHLYYFFLHCMLYS